MKKISLFLCIILVLSFCAFTINAADPSAKGAIVIDSAKDNKGNDIPSGELTVTPVSNADNLPTDEKEELLAAKKLVDDAGSVEEFLKNVGLLDDVNKELDNKKPALVDLVYVSAQGTALSALNNGGVDVVFVVNSIKEGDKIVVLNQKVEAKWEIVESTVDGVKVKVHLDAPSPLAVIINSETAPVDGDNYIVPFIIIGVIALAGVAVLVVKKNKVK